VSSEFDPFGDFEQRGYLQNSGGFKDPARITRIETASFKQNVDKAVADLSKSPLNYQSVLDTHKTLFKDAYPTWAGKDRAETAPDLRVTRGGMASDFAHPDDIKPLVNYALDMSQNHSAGKVYTLLAYAHPFLDGNGRTIMLVQDEVMRRQDKHIEWGAMDKGEYLKTLTQELKKPDEGIMDDYLDRYVKDGALTPQESADKIQANDLGRPAKIEEPSTMDALLSSPIGQIKDPERKRQAQSIHDEMRTRATSFRDERTTRKDKDRDFDIGDD